MSYNKIIYGTKTLIDLTGDSVTADNLLSGITAHDKSGDLITGTCSYDANTSKATAMASEILAGKTAFVKGNAVTGTMKNNGSIVGTIATKSGTYSVPIGYHDGGGKVSIATDEQNKIIASNIREGITILGVTGSMSGSENMKPQAKTVTPTTTKQEILPDENYNCLSSVTVNAIPYNESENEAGGITVTIGV